MSPTSDFQPRVLGNDQVWGALTRQLGGERTVFATFALLHVLLVWIAYEFKDGGWHLAVIWPAAGLLTTALWLAPWRWWPVFIGLQIATELALNTPMWQMGQPAWALVFALTNSLNAGIAAALMRAMNSHHGDVRVVQLLQYLFAGAVGASVGAMIGALAASQDPTANYWQQWQIWWSGKWLGSLTVGPLVYAWSLPFRNRYEQLKVRRGWEILGFFAMVVPVSVWMFSGAAETVLRAPTFLLLLLIGAAFRLPPRWAMLVTTVAIFIAAAASSRGSWLSTMNNVFLRATRLQMILAMFALVTYLLTVLVAELRITLGRVSASEARYRSFIEMSSEAVWRVELDEPMPTRLSPAAQRDWLRSHAHVAECNSRFAQLSGLPGGSEGQPWRGNQPWNAVFEEHIEQAAAAGYSLDGLRFSVRSAGKNHNYIVAFSGVVLQGCLQRIWGVARDITEIADLNARLLREQGRLKSYARQIMTAEERARRATAVDLHDGIAQSLVGMAMTLEVARRQAAPELQVMIDEVRANLRQVQDHTRSMIADLSPPGLYELGLCPALQWLAVYFRGHDGLQVELDCKAREEAIPMELRVLIFKLVRELLRNVVKHAGVRTAKVMAHGDLERVIVQVTDGGRGFDWQMDLFGERMGFGLWSIADRVSQVGGEFKVDSAPGRGSRIELVFALRSTPAQGVDAASNVHKAG